MRCKSLTDEDEDLGSSDSLAEMGWDPAAALGYYRVSVRKQ